MNGEWTESSSATGDRAGRCASVTPQSTVPSFLVRPHKNNKQQRTTNNEFDVQYAYEAFSKGQLPCTVMK